jgi:hypothetical protein
MEPAREKMKAVEVHSVLEERNTDRFKEDLKALQNKAESQNGIAKAESNTSQRQIGSIEKGFRWMKWWVWIDFA